MRRLLVCGGRDLEDQDLVDQALTLFTSAWVRPFVVVHGDAPGADACADAWATAQGDLVVEPHPANWKEHGRSAGPIRNEAMARLGANVCLAFPGGKGTEDMKARALKHGIDVWCAWREDDKIVLSDHRNTRA